MRPTRREVLAAGVAAAAALATARASAAAGAPGGGAMLTRKVPASGEALPVIGLGTWQTFDVGAGSAERAPLREVLERFLAGGGRLVDSSPMYGRAEAVVGELLEAMGALERPFLASKVWTSGQEAGEASARASLERMGRGRMDLLQVHNLVDWRTQLATLRAWKEAGRIRHVGVTHYARSAFDELEQLLRHEPLDFVQLPYSLGLRDAEARLLPLAAERGVAVIVMRPFEGGSLFRAVKGRPLPAWAGAELDCGSWAQFFLKFILGHPAVHCPIPATSNPRHLEDNLLAGRGRLPDARQRARMVQALEA